MKKINNLSELKKFLQIGSEFKVLKHQKPKLVGQLRKVTKVQTNAVYTIIPNEPEEKETLPEVPELPEVPRNNIGRPRTIYRDYETSSEEGLPGNDTRWTVVVDKDLKEALKDYQNTSEYPSMKALINDMVREFLKSKGYEMKQLGDITFYDVQEIAKAFDMTPQSIRKFLKEGRIKARKFGTRWYVTEEAMREYLLGIDNDNKK